MNNTYTQLQGSLLAWLKHHQTRTTNQMRDACVDLLSSVNLESRNGSFKLILPLLRMGLIEFSGNGKYSPSIPLALYYPKSKKAVAVNLSDTQKTIFNKTFAHVETDTFGTMRATCQKPEIVTFCKESKCNFSQPDVSSSLSHFPTISQTVSNFERVAVATSPAEYFDIVHRQWTKKAYDPGIFRCGRDAQKTFFTSEGTVRMIQDGNTNVESRPLVECYIGLNQLPNPITYNKETLELHVSNLTLPILIERILRMASLDVSNAVKQSDTSITFPSISGVVMKEIYRIFETKHYEQSN